MAGFANRHPGGRVILDQALGKKGRPRDLETIWKNEGVSWHVNNENVRKALQGLAKPNISNAL